MIDIVYSIVMTLFIAAVLYIFFYEKKLNLPPVPSLPWVRPLIMKAIKKHTSADTAYKIAEVGSGWGGMIVHLLRHFKNAHVTGFEGSPLPRITSIIRLLPFGKRVRLSGEDFFKVDLSEYDFIFCYLSPRHMAELEPKFKAELKPGTLIISNSFPMPNWQPVDIYENWALFKIQVYIYKV